jgi:hypothetical protein
MAAPLPAHIGGCQASEGLSQGPASAGPVSHAIGRGPLSSRRRKGRRQTLCHYFTYRLTACLTVGVHQCLCFTCSGLPISLCCPHEHDTSGHLRPGAYGANTGKTASERRGNPQSSRERWLASAGICQKSWYEPGCAFQHRAGKAQRAPRDDSQDSQGTARAGCGNYP